MILLFLLKNTFMARKLYIMYLTGQSLGRKGGEHKGKNF